MTNARLAGHASSTTRPGRADVGQRNPHTAAAPSGRPQRVRVLTALLERTRTNKGLRVVDVLPATFDGGPPITRLAAYVCGLRALGFEIENEAPANEAASYRLIPRRLDSSHLPVDLVDAIMNADVDASLILAEGRSLQDDA